MAMGASTMLNRVSTLVNVGYREEMGIGHVDYTVMREAVTSLHEEYINEEDGFLNRRGESI